MNVHEYTIASGKQTFQVQGRDVAVRRARALSAKTWRPIHVQRADEQMEMTFRGGALQAFKMQSSRRRSR